MHAIGFDLLWVSAEQRYRLVAIDPVPRGRNCEQCGVGGFIHRE